MQKRILLGLVVMLSVLAMQDGFFGAKAGILGTPKAKSGQITVIDPTSPSHGNEPLVIRVVDGDTVVALINGTSEKVRLIGVDTPETVDPRKPVQCFGKEASAFTTSLLLNASVRLEADSSQGDRDKYGRLLRYIFLADGTLINKKLITEGYGHEYTYRAPYKYQTEFKNAERLARENKKGLWADGVCDTQK